MTDVLSSNKPGNKPLSGLQILVTRPEHQARSLIQLLGQQGADVFHQAAIRIEAEFNDSQKELLETLEQYDLLIFISKNAVHYGLSLFNTVDGLNKNRPLAAIGKATAQALTDHGFTNIICPDDGFDSEALLNTPAFLTPQINNKKILIIRGGAGREHLKETLEQRQATISYLDVYRRTPAKLELATETFKTLDIITVSSQQGLENLLSMLDNDTVNLLLEKKLITPGDRCSQKAKELGFKQIETAENATDNAMLNCIINTITGQPQQT